MEKNHNPPVSVIILTYNSNLYISETLQSVEGQDYDPVQIVIGDDCSTDNTVQTISKFKDISRHQLLLLTSSSNSGITLNINRCLNLCTGKYIFLLGGDDIFLPHKIQKQVEFMEANPNASISYHDVEVFNSETGRSLYLYNKDKHGFYNDVESLITQGTFNCGCSTAIRNHNLPICNSNIKFASDWLWYMEILIESGGAIMAFDGIHAKYRRHSFNITRISALSTQLDEVQTSLNVVSQKYPEYTKLVEVAKSERFIAYSVKFLLSGNLSFSLKLLILSLRNNLLGIYYFLRRIMKLSVYAKQKN